MLTLCHFEFIIRSQAVELIYDLIYVRCLVRCLLLCTATPFCFYLIK